MAEEFRRSLLLRGAILSTLLRAATPAAAAVPGTDIVILLSVDDWRPDTIGVYGSTRALTPNFDALAGQSTLFTNAFSAASWTRPSHMATMTSMLPSGLSPILVNGPIEHEGPDDRAVPRFDVTLAQALKRNGFATGGFVAHRNLGETYGFSRGFDVYELHQHALGSTQTERALRWLSGREESKKFLFLHYYDIHGANDFEPFHPEYRFYHCDTPAAQAVLKEATTTYLWSDALRDGFDSDRNPQPSPEHLVVMKLQYASCVASLDAELGVFLAGLKRLGLYDDALILVTSDHGEAFGENRQFTHGGAPYPTMIHVPLLLKAPRQRQRRRVDAMASLLDVMPTVLESAAPRESSRLSAQMEGRSLWGEIQTGRRVDAVFAEDSHGPFRAVVSGDGWELIDRVGTDERRLYRLDDPAAEAEETPEVAAERKKLQAIIDERFRGYPGY